LKHSIFVAALAGMALAAAPLEARAQVSMAKPVQIGFAGGAALPTSDLSETANTGFNGTLTVGFNPALVPVGIRVDGESHFGWNVGGGISMPLSGFDTFIEARYNQVQMSNGDPSVKFIPITFGIMF